MAPGGEDAGEVVAEAVVAADAVVVVEDVVKPMSTIHEIPTLGVGLSYRSQFSAEVINYRDKIDFLEIIADHYIDAPAEKLAELTLLKKYFTLIPHAINLSLGSSEGVDLRYLDKLAHLIKLIDPPYWSEHISFTKAGGVEIGHLSPLPFTEESIQVLVRNIAQVSQKIKQPLILENISYLVKIPGEEMEEGGFLKELFGQVSAGLLLDVTNLFYNSQNHQYDLGRFLKAIPHDRITQLHFTGGVYENGRFIDNHSSKAPPEVWEVMKQVCKLNKVKGIILERDDSHPDFEELLEDLVLARKILTESWT